MKKIKDKYAAFLCLFLVPALSEAKSIETILNSTISYLQGSLARSIGVLAIVIAGYLCLYRQKFPKEQFFMILTGLGMIFGGANLYATFVN